MENFEGRFGCRVSATYGLTEAPTVITIENRNEPRMSYEIEPGFPFEHTHHGHEEDPTNPSWLLKSAVNGPSTPTPVAPLGGLNPRNCGAAVSGAVPVVKWNE